MLNSPAHLLLTLIAAAIVVTPAVVLGYRKGRPALGWALGILLGWIGFLILCFVPKTEARKVAEAQQRIRIEQQARQRLG
jgi:hypothetical protein